MKYIPKESRGYNRNKTLNMVHDRLRGLTYGQLALKYKVNDIEANRRVNGFKRYPDYISPIIMICFVLNKSACGETG